MKVLGLSFGRKNFNTDILVKEALFGAKEDAPVYVLQPVGQFKNLVDRFSCRHDVSAINWVLDKRRNGEAPGDPDAFPQERLKNVMYLTFLLVEQLHQTGYPWVHQLCIFLDFLQ